MNGPACAHPPVGQRLAEPSTEQIGNARSV